MPSAKNSTEFYSLFRIPVKNALDYVMDKVLEEYKDEIDNVVYNNYSPSVYERTYDFKNSWETETMLQSKGAQGELKQDVSSIGVNLDKFQHGSIYSGSIVDELTDIIFEGLSGPLFGEGFWTNRRDAWTPLIAKLDGGKIDKWFKEGMKKQGIAMK